MNICCCIPQLYFGCKYFRLLCARARAYVCVCMVSLSLSPCVCVCLCVCVCVCSLVLAALPAAFHPPGLFLTAFFQRCGCVCVPWVRNTLYRQTHPTRPPQSQGKLGCSATRCENLCALFGIMYTPVRSPVRCGTLARVLLLRPSRNSCVWCWLLAQGLAYVHRVQATHCAALSTCSHGMCV